MPTIANPWPPGSSPLARGTPGRQGRCLLLRGLIPARAGNTPQRRYALPPPRAHPRSRGEHLQWRLPPFLSRGSSPLARGTLPFIEQAGTPVGLIPARAGNTLSTGNTSSPLKAHPRSRGEHKFRISKANAVKGSSPLARGTRLRRIIARLARRLIPARAGNTPPTPAGILLMWAHPRSRGEHLIVGAFQASLRGSSPLARGTHARVKCRNKRIGLIPARAGNTGYVRRSPRNARAHPRSRGEHSSFRLAAVD